ncbi:MAG: DedA family protein [Patescibacteria group bacterium]|jgi:undecaprenyl-diphosphatase
MEKGLDFFLSILAKFGWLGNWLFLFIALTECVPFFGGFFPGGTLVSIGGFLAAQGYFKIWDIVIFAVIGAVSGDYLGYSLGRWGGGWLERRGLVKKEWLARGENFFKKYGAKSIFWGRYVGATRAVVPFIAGAARMKQSRFFLWNLAGAIFWASYSAFIGYFSGSLIAVIIKKWSHQLGFIILVIIAAAIIYWVIKKRGQSIWRFFKKQSLAFTDWLLDRSWFKRFDSRYPITEEFFRTTIGRERIFGVILWLIVLIMLYGLALILDFI